MIIGASFDSAGVTDEGTARVYLGSNAGLGSGTYVWLGRGGQIGSWYGRSVASAGDVNGDGFADILVGSPKYTGVLTEEGRAQLYYGGSGRGVPLRPRQTTNVGSPLVHMGAADTLDSYQVHYANPIPGDDQSAHPDFGIIAGAQRHWRVRWSYMPATNPFLPNSRWIHMPYHGWNEPDLRGGGFSVFLPLLYK